MRGVCYRDDVVKDTEPSELARLVLDAFTRRNGDGSTLLGGAPYRVLKLSERGKGLLDEWLESRSSSDRHEAASRASQTALWRQLVDAGLVHPLPAPAERVTDTAAVIPVLDDVDGLEALLPPLREAMGPDAPIVVVDDGSTDQRDIADAAAKFGAIVLRHEENQGPAVARNTGWKYLAETSPDVGAIVFIDADVVIEQDALLILLGHLELDPTVGVVAPRVATLPEPSAMHRYELTNSPLDMGSTPARVHAFARVPFVPSATILVRTALLEDIDGFDPDLRVGEDVDLVWRANHVDWSVRYDPRAVVVHRGRRTLKALMRQRFAYGTSAVQLEDRHPHHVFPVELSIAHTAIWVSALWGGRRGKLASAIGYVALVAQLGKQLRPTLDDATVISACVVMETNRYGLKWLANAGTRAWAPLLIWNRTTRRCLLAALLGPAVFDWWSQGRLLDPFRFVFYRAVDHGAYSAGVWDQAQRERSFRALLPSIRRY